MRKIPKDDYFTLYVFLMDWHSGQWGRGYRLMCKLGTARLTASCIEECRFSRLYDYLQDNYKETV